MQKFWKLTNDFIVSENGVKLFQLELIVDCKWGTAGAKGGYIEKEDNLFGDAWVSGNAKVYGGKFEKSPLQIQGTKHFVCIPKPGYLKIGCEERLISDWESNYIEIGDENEYSESEKEEYFEYIKIAKKIMHNYVE